MKKTIELLLEEFRKDLPIEIFPEREEEFILILMELCNVRRYEINILRSKILDSALEDRFRDIIEKRKTGKALAYILGYKDFYQDRFPVSEQTLIPRFDTEILIEEVRKHYNKNAPHSILDIGTGTGAIALSLYRLFPQTKILGIDIFDQPFKNSQKSLMIFNPNISVQKVDFLDKSTWNTLGKWSCIVSNPPYLSKEDMNNLDPQVKDFEPHTALQAGTDGMIFYQAIEEFARTNLSTRGMIFLEIDYKYKEVIKIFEKKYSYELVYDYSHLPRVLCLKN